ncbi:hypothetical protein [Papillibacter cinnamivorans]|uniref:hypothetical protein n=1 Tax=Papillibacter cinnamivorans TaxID=100176 RepID=UPI000A031EDA|nr:hypothetical protein [Papillibacter cinnamivorans]
MKLFSWARKKNEKAAGVISISQVELESAIVSAYSKIKKMEDEESKLRGKTDIMTGSLQVLVVIFCIAIIAFASIVGWYSGNLFYQSLVAPVRTFHLVYFLVVLAAIGYVIYAVILLRTALKEYDRSFLAAYLSSLTSIAALAVAFIALQNSLH